MNNTPQGESTEGNVADDTLMVNQVARREYDILKGRLETRLTAGYVQYRAGWTPKKFVGFMTLFTLISLSITQLPLTARGLPLTFIEYTV